MLATLDKEQSEPEAQKNLTVCCECLLHFCSFVQETSYTRYMYIRSRCLHIARIVRLPREGLPPPPPREHTHTVAMVMDDARSGAPGNSREHQSEKSAMYRPRCSSGESHSKEPAVQDTQKHLTLFYCVVQYLLTHLSFNSSRPSNSDVKIYSQISVRYRKTTFNIDVGSLYRVITR
jgi:hypothetical protein